MVWAVLIQPGSVRTKPKPFWFSASGLQMLVCAACQDYRAYYFGRAVDGRAHWIGVENCLQHQNVKCHGTCPAGSSAILM